MLQGPLPFASQGPSRYAALLGRLSGYLQHFGMLLVKIATAGSMALVFVLVARSMDSHDFGRLSVWFNIVSFVGVIAAFSQDGVIIRLWFEHLSRKEYDLVHGAFRSGWMVTAISGSLFALVVGVTAYFVEDAGIAASASVAAFVLAAALSLYSVSCGRNIYDVLLATTFTDLPWRLGLLVVSAICLATGIAMTIPIFFTTAAAGLVAGLIVVSLITATRFPAEVRNARPVYQRKRWLFLSSRMLVSTSMEGISQYAEVVLIGLFMHPAAAGGFFAAQRIAAIFPMMMTGILGYTAIRTPSLYFEGKTTELQALFRRAMGVLMPMVLMAMLFVLLAGPFLLGLFGDEYRDEYPTLLLLSLGYCVLACGGTSIMNLLLTGHEAVYARIQGVSLIVRMILVVVLSQQFGGAGAAGAILLVNGPLTIALVLASRRRLGADPSILAFFSKTPD